MSAGFNRKIFPVNTDLKLVVNALFSSMEHLFGESSSRLSAIISVGCGLSWPLMLFRSL